ncbi:hypothetical protein [Streptacidiphilus cavernicola]|uniref:Uncharacterized protein n=1 Tax=Streptacidiphilus cavernicola TaxID=3342716 RepID=A0ABV6W2L1_9ACTN
MDGDPEGMVGTEAVVDAEAVVDQVQSARARVRAAVASHDAGALSAAMDKLEEALHRAREDGVDVPAAPVAPAGPAAPGNPVLPENR